MKQYISLLFIVMFPSLALSQNNSRETFVQLPISVKEFSLTDTLLYSRFRSALNLHPLNSNGNPYSILSIGIINPNKHILHLEPCGDEILMSDMVGYFEVDNNIIFFCIMDEEMKHPLSSETSVDYVTPTGGSRLFYEKHARLIDGELPISFSEVLYYPQWFFSYDNQDLFLLTILGPYSHYPTLYDLLVYESYRLPPIVSRISCSVFL